MKIIDTKLDEIIAKYSKRKKFHSNNFDIHEKINEMSYIQSRNKEQRRTIKIELKSIIKTMNESNTVKSIIKLL